MDLIKRLEDKKIIEDDNIQQAWDKLKTNQRTASEEACGKRKVKTAIIKNKPPWFRIEIKILGDEKRKTYLQHKLSRKPDDVEAGKQIRNKNKMRIRQIKEEKH